MISAKESKKETDSIILGWFMSDMLRIEKEIQNTITNGEYQIYETDLDEKVMTELKRLGYVVTKTSGLNETNYEISWK